MRIISGLAGAALLVGVASAVAAQTPAAQTNPNTKVYAYKQTAPKAKSTSMGARQQKPFELLPDAVPHGSEKWWEINARSNTGGDGGGP
jgi:hypothetical protein